MRQEPNNGIDLLLRQMGRREESLSPELDGQHLDADELNSYVANALPPAARARYTRHLADCSSCRKIVAQLGASEAVVAVKLPVSVIEPSGFKSFLASLFSPMVLRYAVPALGLIVVAAIGVVVLRQDQKGTSVATVQNTEQTRSASEDRGAVANATPAPAQPSIVKKPAASVPAREEAEQPIVSAAAPPPAPKAAPADDAERQPEPEKKKLGTTEAESKASEDARREYDSTKREQQRQTDVGGAAAESGPSASPGNKVGEPQRAKAAEVVSDLSSSKARPESGRARKDEPGAAFLMSAETKSVSGRTFQKRGEIWIDTAYTSPRSTTNIARGSEQYRALVADEPDIQTIADTLKSEFIVVWKGRPYRIR